MCLSGHAFKFQHLKGVSEREILVYMLIYYTLLAYYVGLGIRDCHDLDWRIAVV